MGKWRHRKARLSKMAASRAALCPSSCCLPKTSSTQHLLEDFPKERQEWGGGGGWTPSCLGEVRPHRGCCGSLTVNTVPGAPMLTPVQCCRIDSFCSVSQRKVRAHQPGSLSEQRWEVRPGWSKRLHPQAQRCSARASWYLELSGDGFDDSG